MMTKFRYSLLFAFFVTPCFSASFHGTFNVTNSCPAYTSIKKQLNPGDITLKPGESYPIDQVNNTKNPQWYAIHLQGMTDNNERWVSKDCGNIVTNPPCNNQPGLADSYLLSLGWQATFCSSSKYHQSKQECQPGFRVDKNYQFTLHGLWPNQKACGKHYGHCNNSIRPEAQFCDYVMFEIEQKHLDTLNRQMPGANTKDCLDRHEWYKHGSCQFMSAGDYFSTAANFTQEINNSSFGQYIRNNIGKTIKRKTLLKKFEQSFGKDSAKKIYIGCYNNFLMSLNITLPVITEDNAQQSLSSLIQQAPNSPHENDCSKQLTIMAPPNGA